MGVIQVLNALKFQIEGLPFIQRALLSDLEAVVRLQDESSTVD